LITGEIDSPSAISGLWALKFIYLK